MIRILVVDDLPNPAFVEDMRRSIEGSFTGTEVQTRHFNPVEHMPNAAAGVAEASLLESIADAASEFWDVVIIDLNLYEAPVSADERLYLALAIAEKVREVNRSATVILYSGTMQDYVRRLLAAGDPEEALKLIYRTDISRFVPRDQIADEVQYALDDPSWLLRIERKLLKHHDLVVVAQEPTFGGRTFQELASAVRRQDNLGRELAEAVAEFGIAGLAELGNRTSRP